MRQLYFIVLFSLLSFTAQAQVGFTDATIQTINFNNFDGSGLSPGSASGALNSNDWRINGFSDQLVTEFGGTYTTGDFARGTVSAAVSEGGLWAVQLAASPLDRGLIIQPTGPDFTPGTITLRLQNNSDNVIESFQIGYNIIVRNDQGRSTSLNFAHSADDVTYTAVTDLDYATTTTSAGTIGKSTTRTTTITGLSIPKNGYYYIQWQSDDVAGSGLRDEIGLDGISITATFGTSSGAGIFSFQNPPFDVEEGSATNVTSSDFTVTRSGGANGIVEVRVNVVGGTATAGTDFVNNFPKTLIFLANERTKTFNLETIFDTELEGDETVELQLSIVSGGGTLGSVPTATLTIIDDDFPFTINEFLPVPTTDANLDDNIDSGEDEFIEIINTSSTAQNIGGYYFTDNSGTIYTFPDGTIIEAGQAAVVFGGGNPGTKTGVSATPFGCATVLTAGTSLGLNDTGDQLKLFTSSGLEAAESFTYGSDDVSSNESFNRNPDLSGDFALHTEVAGSNGTYSPGFEVDGTTTFGGACNTIQFGATEYTIVEGNTGTTTLSIEVTRTGATSSSATVDLVVADGTANSGSDYAATTPQHLTFGAGVTSVNGTITINSDNTSEFTETILLSLQNASSADIISIGSPSTATAFIENDDAPQVVSISEVQGSGSSSPIENSIVEIQGVVTLLMPAYNGFFIQSAGTGDDDDATSDGVFVQCSSCDAFLAVGNLLRVIGEVIEVNEETRIDYTSLIPVTTSVTLPTARTLSLPLTTTQREAVEGMLVNFAQTLQVTNNESLASEGQFSISSQAIYYTTQYTDPNDSPASGTSNNDDNSASIATEQSLFDDFVITVDDLTPVAPGTPPNLDADNTLRIGTPVNKVDFVVSQIDDYLLQYTAPPIDGTGTNRPTSAPSYPGTDNNFNVISMNLNGYDGSDTDATNKLVAALDETTPDVIALVGTSADAASTLLDALNTASTTTFALTNPSGSGASVANLFFYNTGTVSLITTAVDESSIHERAPFAALFQVIGETAAANASNDGVAWVVANFFSDRTLSGTTTTSDGGDAQGINNDTRVQQANALLSFVENSLKNNGTQPDPDVLLIGDFNAYYQEDPIDVLREGGFTTLLQEGNYTIVDGGRLGSRTQALTNAGLQTQGPWADVWNINAAEPAFIATTQTTNAFRSSNQDPVFSAFVLGTAVDPPTPDPTPNPTPLPVELMAFNATELKSTVRLDWATAQEIDNAGFTIQRSSDGVRFEDIAFVAGAGTVQEARQYQYTDVQPLTGVSYYRLQQQDFDGTISYSKMVRIVIEEVAATAALQWQLAPNPTADAVNIKFSSSEDCNLNIRLISSTGKVVSNVNHSLTIGATDWEQPQQDRKLSPGIYLIQVTNTETGERQVKRLLVQ